MLTRVAAALALLTAIVAPASAAVVTSIPGGTVLAMPAANVFSSGPTTLAPGVTWNSTSGSSVFGYTGGYGLAANGFWSGSPPYIGLNSPEGTMTFAFSTFVSAVGGFINYAPGHSTPLIAVYDASHTLIESAVLNISTPSESNGGQFFGFTETTPIAYFTLSNAYIVMRDLTITSASVAVPEPGTFALIGSALLGLMLMRRRSPQMHAA